MMTTKQTILGEYGLRGGRDVVEVVLVRGHSAEIRKLWRELDSVGGSPREDEIFRRLEKIGAVRRG